MRNWRRSPFHPVPAGKRCAQAFQVGVKPSWTDGKKHIHWTKRETTTLQLPNRLHRREHDVGCWDGVRRRDPRLHVTSVPRSPSFGRLTRPAIPTPGHTPSTTQRIERNYRLPVRVCKSLKAKAQLLTHCSLRSRHLRSRTLTRTSVISKVRRR
jgi:hypothetical protein